METSGAARRNQFVQSRALRIRGRFTSAPIFAPCGVKISLFAPGLFLCLVLCAGGAIAQTTIVDIIPKSLQTEHEQNSEPNIAVDPCDATKIVISVFSHFHRPNPIFISKDGAATWSVLQRIPAGDMSVGWAGAFDGYLTVLSTRGSSIATLRLHDPTIRSRFRGVTKSIYRPGGIGPDQPWTEATLVNGVDRIYVAFNDFSQPSRTASVHQSLDGGHTWQTFAIERGNPGLGRDGSAVRVTSNGDRAYAAFQRFNSMDFNGDVTGDIVVVRDDAGGADQFNDLGAGAGMFAATGELLPQGDPDFGGVGLGQERLGSDLSIAVDPNDPDRVAVAYAAIRSGQKVVVIDLSTNAGAMWNEIFSTTNSDCALPALAIADNGAIGLLYTLYDGTNLETHLVQSPDEFTSQTDLTLSVFEDQSLVPDFSPFIGDYEDLAAVGNFFYGAFSASNDVSQFPQKPVFLRDETLLGTAKVPFSIDPFFFKTPALP